MSNVKYSKKNDRRFYNQKDMSELRHAIEVYNSRVKRGEVKPYNNIDPCHCGARGCFLLYKH